MILYSSLQVFNVIAEFVTIEVSLSSITKSEMPFGMSAGVKHESLVVILDGILGILSVPS